MADWKTKIIILIPKTIERAKLIRRNPSFGETLDQCISLEGDCVEK